MFKCKVCPEKELRINELKDQIEDLRKLVFPKNNQALSDDSYELDPLLNGVDQYPIQMTNEMLEAEAAALLSGNYDNSQVQI